MIKTVKPSSGTNGSNRQHIGTTNVRTAINSSALMQRLVASLPDKDKASTVAFLEAVLTDMDGITEKLRAAIQAVPHHQTPGDSVAKKD